MKLNYFLLFLIIFFFSDIYTQDQILIQLPSNALKSPKHYMVPKAQIAPIIDGIGNDDCWEKVPFSEKFIDILGLANPEKDTRIKLLWDENYFYIFAVLEEDHIWGDITERDEIIFFNNDFEVFLDPEGKGGPYGEIEINALGTEWDLLLTKAYRAGGKAVFNWNIQGLKTAVHINGTLNNPSDIDESWSVEMAIPMLSLTELITRKKPYPKAGEVWRANFSRVQWEHEIIEGQYQRKKNNNRYVSEQNWVWSPQFRIDMHMPEKWGYLHFVDDINDGKLILSSEYSKEINILFAIYHRIVKEEIIMPLDLKPGSSVELLIEIQDQEIIPCSFFKTHTGFELVISNNLNELFSIDQEGKTNISK